MTQSDKERVERIRHSAKECYPVSFTEKDVLFLLSLLDKQQEAIQAVYDRTRKGGVDGGYPYGATTGIGYDCYKIARDALGIKEAAT